MVCPICCARLEKHRFRELVIVRLHASRVEESKKKKNKKKKKTKKKKKSTMDLTSAARSISQCPTIYLQSHNTRIS